ncbi:MAG TPA: hypothetical protein VF755_29905 [Catenuloplanes sp.]
MRTPRPAVRTRRGGPALLAVVLVVLAAGCGSGPAPRVWAAAVCQALSPWRVEIGTLTSRTQQQMTAETTPAQARENLVRLFAGAQAASEAARHGVERAGVPDVAGGEAVASGFLASLTAVRDAYGRAGERIAALNIASANAFYTEVEKVVQTLDTEYRRSALDTSKLDSPELRRAFDEVPECR